MIVFVYLIDYFQKLFLGNISRKKDLLACNSKCLAAFCSALFVGDIAGILSHTDNAQSGINALALKLCNICLNALIQRCGYFFT